MKSSPRLLAYKCGQCNLPEGAAGGGGGVAQLWFNKVYSSEYGGMSALCTLLTATDCTVFLNLNRQTHSLSTSRSRRRPPPAALAGWFSAEGTPSVVGSNTFEHEGTLPQNLHRGHENPRDEGCESQRHIGFRAAVARGAPLCLSSTLLTPRDKGQGRVREGRTEQNEIQYISCQQLMLYSLSPSSPSLAVCVTSRRAHQTSLRPRSKASCSTSVAAPSPYGCPSSLSSIGNGISIWARA